ncbi:MAG: hypothetical protein C5S41_07585, partial [Candidatus Methanomarinus sp.]
TSDTLNPCKKNFILPKKTILLLDYKIP